MDRIMTADPDDDLRALLEQATAGDATALDRLIARLSSRVRAWAARFTGDTDEADDVAQEVLLALGRRIARFDRRRRFTTWLFVVTRHAAVSARRRDRRRRGLAAAFLQHVPVSAVSATDERAEDIVKLNALVLDYFHSLPPKQRLVFELADLRGMSCADVARQLGMQPATVRAHLFKARTSIRRRLIADHETLVRDYRS